MGGHDVTMDCRRPQLNDHLAKPNTWTVVGSRRATTSRIGASLATALVITLGAVGCGGRNGAPPVSNLLKDETRVTIGFLHVIRTNIGSRFRFIPGQDFCSPDRAVGRYRCQYVDVHETNQPQVAPVIQNHSSRSLSTETSALTSVAAMYDVKIANGRWRGTLHLLNDPSPVRDFAADASTFPATLSGTY